MTDIDFNVDADERNKREDWEIKIAVWEKVKQSDWKKEMHCAWAKIKEVNSQCCSRRRPCSTGVKKDSARTGMAEGCIVKEVTET